MAYALVGTDASYFTGKVRSYLHWKGVDFRDVAATPEVYRDIIESRVGFPVIPILITPDDEVVQDSFAIIEHIERDLPSPSVYPDGAVQTLASLLLQLYADEWLVIPAMHYRWTYNEEWIFAEFGRNAAPSASVDEQKRVGRIAGERFREFAPKLGVSDEAMAGIEAHYEGFLADFAAHLRVMPFLFGDRPTLGDFAFFGPLYAHLYRDPASGERMKALAPGVVDWVERMLAIKPGGGALVGGDQIPETLLPILKRQMSEQLPVLADAARAFGEWAEIQPSGARVPRQLGVHDFIIGGQHGERAIITFSLWRLQAALDQYAGLDGEARHAADRLLAAIGGEAIAGFPAPRRLERRDFRLVVT